MKILFFLHKIGPYHHARFNCLAKHCNLSVVEILPDSKEYEWEKVKDDKSYEIIQLREQLGGQEKKGAQLKCLVKELFYLSKPDLCVVTGWDNRTYLAALLESKSRNIPIACVSDSTYNDSKRWWLKELLKSYIISPFDAFLVAGVKSSNYLKILKVEAPVYSPWDVVDNEYFRKPIIADLFESLPKNYILCVARFIWEKNLEGLVKGFSIFIKNNPSSDLNLVIVGAGTLKAEVEALIFELKIDRLQLIPFLQYDRLPAIYSKAKALILPSVKDTWGLVVNEAMAAGLPIIVSEKCGCVPDLVQEGINGFICKTSASSIAECIEKLEKLNTQQLFTMGNSGQNRIKNFDLDSFKDAIMNIYNDVAQKPLRKTRFVPNRLINLKINMYI